MTMTMVLPCIPQFFVTIISFSRFSDMWTEIQANVQMDFVMDNSWHSRQKENASHWSTLESGLIWKRFIQGTSTCALVIAYLSDSIKLERNCEWVPELWPGPAQVHRRVYLAQTGKDQTTSTTWTEGRGCCHMQIDQDVYIGASAVVVRGISEAASNSGSASLPRGPNFGGGSFSFKNCSCSCFSNGGEK